MNTIINIDWKKAMSTYPLAPYTLHPDRGVQFERNEWWYIGLGFYKIRPIYPPRVEVKEIKRSFNLQ